jgi:hypothetical protein
MTMEETTSSSQTAPTELPDNLAVRFAAGLLGPQWKQGHDRKKRLQRRTVLSDCRLMLRYALDEGCQISDELSKNIAKVDTALINAKLDPLSEVPKELIQKAQSGAEDQQPRDQQGVAPQPVAKDQQPQAQQGAEPISTPTPTPTSTLTPTPSPTIPPTPTATPESLNDVIMRVHNALSGLVAPATALSLRATDPDIVLWGFPWIAQFAIIGALISTVLFILAVPKPHPATTQKSAAGSATASVSLATASTLGTTATPSP